MKKVFLISIILVGMSISLNAEPYKPYPVLWIHGINSSSGTWGAPTRNRSDSIPGDTLDFYPDATYSQFLNYMNPVATFFDTSGIDRSFTRPGEDAYPNKAFLEVINFDDNQGSIDESAKYPGPYSGQGDELWYRIKEVMEEYYGDNWDEDSTNKIILVAHSAGGLSIRECLYSHYDVLKPHIAKVITAGSPHTGCELANLTRALRLLDVGQTLMAFIFAFGGEEAMAWITGGAGLFDALVDFSGMKVGAYSELGKDAVSDSDLLKKLNKKDNFQGDGYSWHCLAGRGGYHIDVTGEILTGTGGFLMGLGWLTWNYQWVLIGANCLVRGTYLWDFGNNADGLMTTINANINYVDNRYNSEVKKMWRLSHTPIDFSLLSMFATPYETEQWKIFRNFIESPPTLDSMLLTTRLEDSTVVDTSYFTPDTIDTIVGNLDSVSVNFKLMDSYFLSQADVKININGVSSGGINYPEETSLTARV